MSEKQQQDQYPQLNKTQGWIQFIKDIKSFNVEEKETSKNKINLINEQIENILTFVKEEQEDKQELKEFFYKNIFIDLVSLILDGGKYEDLEIFNIVDIIIENIVKIIALELRTNKDYLQLSKVFSIIFNTEIRYYTDNNQDDGLYVKDDGNIQDFTCFKTYQCKSKSLRRYLNTFGELEGFEYLLKRIDDNIDWLSIEVMANYLQGVGSKNIDAQYTLYFLNEFVPKLKQSLYSNITNTPKEQLKHLNAVRYDIIKNCLVNLCEKMNFFIVNDCETAIFLEDFCLQTSLLCLQSEQLSQQVNGIKQMSEIIDNYRRKVSAEYVQQWIEDNNIFEIIFDKVNSHEQMLQRSDKLLRFMLKQKMIGQKHIDDIVNLLEKNQETFFCLCKIIDQVSYYLTVEHVEMLINRMLINQDKLNKDHIELIYNIQYWIDSQNKDNKDNVKSIKDQVFKFYLSLINNKEVIGDLLNETINCTGKMIKFDKSDDTSQLKEKFIVQTIDNIKQYVATSNNLKFLKELIETYPSPMGYKYNKDDLNIQEIVVKICKEMDFINIMLNNIKNIKNQMKNNIEENKVLYIQKLQQRIGFLIYLIDEQLEKEIHQVVNYEFLSIFWEELVFNSLILEERDLIYTLFKKIDKNKIQEDIYKFFDEKMFEKEDFLLNISQLGFQCFQSIFIAVNKSKDYLQSSVAAKNSKLSYYQQKKQKNEEENANCILKVLPQNLLGFDKLLKVLHEVENKEIFQKSCRFYIQICLNLHAEINSQQREITDKLINDQINDLNKIQEELQKDKNNKLLLRQLDRCLYLIVQLFGETEQKGFGGLKSHTGLVQGDIITVLIKNEFNSARLTNNQLKIWTNTTLIQLRMEIGKMINTSWDKLKLIVNNNILKDTDNGRTIRDLRLQDQQTIVAQERDAQEKYIPYYHLKDENGELMPKPLSIFTDWFNQFSIDGKMTKETCKQFLAVCFGKTNVNDSDNSTLQSVFQDNDKEKKGYLVLSDFINLYAKAAPINEASDELKCVNAVFCNLRAFGYRQDLQKISEIKEDYVEIDKLPRYVLSQNEEFYNLLFKLLKQVLQIEGSNQTAERIMDVLNYLPTSKKIYEQIQSLQGIDNLEDENRWDNIFDKSCNFKFLYSLIVIQNLIEGNEKEVKNENENDIVQEENKQSENQQQLEEKLQNQEKNQTENEQNKEWCERFIRYGGFVQLQNIFQELVQKDEEQLSILEKRILSFILKLMKNFLSAIFSQNVQFLYQITDYIRLPIYNLEKIQQYLNQDENEEPDRIEMERKLLEEQEKQEQIKQQEEIKKQQEEQKQQQQELKKLEATKLYDIKCGCCNGKLQYVEDPYQADVTEGISFGFQCSVCYNNYDNGEGAYHCGCQSDGYDVCTTCYTYSGQDNIVIPGPETKVQSKQIKNNTTLNNKDNKKDKDDKAQRIFETDEFKMLKEKLNGELGDTIISKLDIPDLSLHIQTIITNLLTKKIQSEEKQIIELGISILCSIYLYSNEELDKFSKNQSTSIQFILNGLFNDRMWIRTLYQRFLFILQRNRKNQISEWLIKTLINNIPSSKDKSKLECNEFYELLCKIIENRPDKLDIDLSTLLQNVIESIINHQSIESSHNNDSNDKILMGYLQFAEQLLKDPSLAKGQSQLVKLLFDTCLYTANPLELLEQNEDILNSNNLKVNPQGYLKCQLNQSRNLIYSMIVEILKNNQEIIGEFFKNSLIPLIKQVPSTEEFNYKPERYQKSYTGYAGIHNLQNICYMNCMLQQFFHTKSFRYGILAADDKEKPNLVVYNKTDRRDYAKKTFKDDNILHQFQKLFSYLEITERRHFVPLEFCFSMKGYDQEPTNVVIQQDTQEFMNMFFDRIEKNLTGTPWRDLVINTYGGVMASQLICQGCGNNKETPEKFYTWSLTVQNKKSLEESLKNMTEGEEISDYQCGNCNKKENQQKRVLMDQLPNFLVLHLQRIIFDLDTFLNRKISDKFEFSEVLNVYPYTKQGIQETEAELEKKLPTPVTSRKNSEINEPNLSKNSSSVQIKNGQELGQFDGIQNAKDQQQYEYKLKGVVVHSGTAEGGHYFSFINTNDNTWCEFNDSLVKSFDPKDISKECFGGSTNNDGFYDQDRGDSSSNAYILVYEKVIKSELQFNLKNNEELQEVQQKLVEDCIKQNEIERLQNLLEKKEQQEKLKQQQQEEQEQEKQEQNSSEEGEENSEQKQEQPILKVSLDSIKDNLISKELKKEVWLDNHNFMLEKQYYNENFFEFLKKILDIIKIPEEFQMSYTDTTNVKFCNRNTISDELYQLLKFMIEDFLPEYLFKILVKANDNKIITDMLPIFKKIFCLVPEFAESFLMKNYFNNKECNILDEYILKCPDQEVRNLFSELLLFLINITITYKNIDLTLLVEAEQIDSSNLLSYKINEYLVNILELLNTEIAKNWVRVDQILNFWLNFVKSGEMHTRWAYSQELIARMIDFILAKQSPLPEEIFGRKIHQMGTQNEYNDAYSNRPSFKQVYELLNILIPLSNIDKTEEQEIKDNKYILSTNDIICLKSKLFYEKALKDSGDTKSLQILIKKLCKDDYSYSKNIASMILERIELSNESNAYWVDILDIFLEIEDSLQSQRIEWIFGILQMKMDEGKFALKAFYKKMTGPHGQLVTPIYKNSSFIDIMFREQATSGSYYYQDYRMVQILSLLDLMMKNEKVFRYVAPLPSLCYIGGDYYWSWCEKYISNYQFANKNDKQKSEISKKCMDLLDQVKTKVDQYIEQNIFVKPKIYIMGNTVETISESEDYQEGLQIIKTDYKIKLVENKCNFMDNKTLVFPQKVMDTDNSVDHKKVPKESNIYDFIYIPQNMTTGYMAQPPEMSDEYVVQGEIFEENYIKMIIIDNSSDQTVYLSYYFEELENQNFYAPRHNIFYIIEPKNKLQCILHKKECGKDFGPLGLKINILSKEEYEEKNLKSEKLNINKNLPQFPQNRVKFSSLRLQKIPKKLSLQFDEKISNKASPTNSYKSDFNNQITNKIYKQQDGDVKFVDELDMRGMETVNKVKFKKSQSDDGNQADLEDDVHDIYDSTQGVGQQDQEIDESAIFYCPSCCHKNMIYDENCSKCKLPLF